MADERTPSTQSQQAETPTATVQWTDAKTAEDAIGYAKRCLSFNDAIRAYRMVKALIIVFGEYKDMAQKYSGLYEKYVYAQHLAQGAALPLLSDQEVLGIFEEEFADLLRQQEFLPIKQTEAKLLHFTIHEERDEYKKKLRDALLRNQEEITKSKIKTGEKTASGTIGNWIQDYNETLGTEEIDTLRQTQYYNESANAKNLSEEERDVLKRLFQLYEYLKQSSLTPEGLEEDVSIVVGNEHKVLSDGKIYNVPNIESEELLKEALQYTGHLQEDTSEDTVPTDPLDALRRIYKGDATIEQGVHVEMEALTKAVQGKTDKLIERLLQSLEEKQLVTTRAALAILARNKRFDELMKHEQVRKQVEKILRERYGEEVVRHFDAHPDDSAYVLLYLQHVLQDIHEQEPDEAARIGVTLANEYADRGDERYVDLAYADTEQLQFVWSKVVQDGERLRIANE